MAGIPLHITPLSYIRGNGSQYITTDIYLRSTDVVKSKWRFEGAAGNVYGCFSGSSENDNFCLYAGSSSVFAYIRYNGQLVRDFKATNGTIYEIEQGPDGFKTDGVNASFTPATFTCSAPMYIFMLPNSTSAKVTARCYGLTVYRDGEQLCNFIPARNELTREVGFYESVNGVFYENAGTGVFGEGPEVNFSVKTLLLKRRRALLGSIPTPKPYDAQVEYVDGNGTFVDTLFTLGDHRIVAETQFSNGYANNASLFGIWNYRTQSNLSVTLYNNKFYFGTGPYSEKNVAPAQPFDTGWHTYTLSGMGLLQVDQDVLYNTANSPVISNTTAFIFARHAISAYGTENPNQYAKCPAGFRCRSFKIYDNTNDALVFDGIPVRIGTVGYIYDQISGQVFGGANGIDLVPGNDI